MAKITLRVWILITFLLLALLMISPTFQKGIVITSVEKNTTAFESGLRPGMKIQEINSQKIDSLQKFSEIALTFNKENETRISIVTNQGTFIYLEQNLSSFTVSQIPRSKIKTGLDLSGGARALIKPKNKSLSDSEISDLVAITSSRLNTFGLSDVNVRQVKDLNGNNFMLVEIAGSTPSDLKE